MEADEVYLVRFDTICPDVSIPYILFKDRVLYPLGAFERITMHGERMGLHLKSRRYKGIDLCIKLPFLEGGHTCYDDTCVDLCNISQYVSDKVPSKKNPIDKLTKILQYLSSSNNVDSHPIESTPPNEDVLELNQRISELEHRLDSLNQCVLGLLQIMGDSKDNTRGMIGIIKDQKECLQKLSEGYHVHSS